MYYKYVIILIFGINNFKYIVGRRQKYILTYNESIIQCQIGTVGNPQHHSVQQRSDLLFSEYQIMLLLLLLCT